MQKVAFVTSAKWRRSGDEYTLEPDDNLREREAQNEENRRWGQFHSTVTKAIADLEKREREPQQSPKSLKPSAEADQDESGPNPLKLAALRIISLMGRDAFPFAPTVTIRVWASNSATSFQELMPTGSDQILAKGIAEYNKLVSSRPLSNDGEGTAHPITDVSKCLLSFSITDDFPSYSLKIFGANGACVGMEADSLLDRAAEDSDSSSKVNVQEPLAFTSELAKSYSSRLRGSRLRSLTPVFRSEMADVVNHDPLSYAVSDLLECYRRNTNPRIIASVPDELWSYANLLAARRLTPEKGAEEVCRRIESHTVLESSNSDGVSLLKPSYPSYYRSRRMDRRRLELLLQKKDNNGCPSLADLCTYVSTGPSASLIESAYLRMFSPAADVDMISSRYLLLSLYTTLSGAQLQFLENGGSIPFAQLSGDQRALIAGFALSDEASWGGDLAALNQDDLTGDMGKEETPPTLGTEPTEILPNGLSRGFVTVQVRSEPIIFYSSEKSMFWRSAYNGSRFGAIEWSGEKQGTEVPTLGQLGQKHYLAFAFHFSPGTAVHSYLTDIEMPADSEVTSVEAFPEEFLRLRRATAKALAEQSKGDGTEEVVKPR